MIRQFDVISVATALAFEIAAMHLIICIILRGVMNAKSSFTPLLAAIVIVAQQGTEAKKSETCGEQTKATYSRKSGLQRLQLWRFISLL
jgi:hypothetical protein